MARERIHRFESEGKRFAIDTETCFCFECDAISWDVLQRYPQTPANRIYHELAHKHDRAELAEVVGELEWLRATGSIVPDFKPEDAKKLIEFEKGLKKLSLELPEAQSETRPWRGRSTAQDAPYRERARSLGRDAIALLLGRARDQEELELEIIEPDAVRDLELLGDLCSEGLRVAALAGKRLTVAVRVSDVEVPKAPEALRGHALSMRIELAAGADVRAALRGFAKAQGRPLASWAKALQSEAESVLGRIVLRPGNAALGAAVEALDNAGFAVIELDVDGAYLAEEPLTPAALVQGLRDAAVYYAHRLLRHHYFRLDPVASLFWRIYNGAPQARSDPAGTNELAVDSAGVVYPSRLFIGKEDFRLGTVKEGAIDEEARKRLDDVGSATTSACIRCWARNLCGGGPSAVHHALTGDFHTPHEPWCQGQRAWIEAAVVAFNVLSGEGVNFTRVYHTLRRTARPSLFTMARAAFRMSIGVRPIEEADAVLLRDWENWNGAAYFTFTDAGLLLATKYDREMDSLHPQGVDQELMLLRKEGSPFGMLKLRPGELAGLAHGWVYMHDPADYASEAIRKGFRFILKEAASGQDVFRQLLVPAGPSETALADFLRAVGFQQVGVCRDGLYLHGRYHDVALYAVQVDAL
ncbi:MAG TPA: SPASM domain-containing protein [Candidatus Hydrogenedentes bacterium]|nr:SPASM domain-containing protein [Candidatus Hydrogenedentota bacterium]